MFSGPLPRPKRFCPDRALIARESAADVSENPVDAWGLPAAPFKHYALHQELYKCPRRQNALRRFLGGRYCDGFAVPCAIAGRLPEGGLGQ
jgi:hypothetical protein